MLPVSRAHPPPAMRRTIRRGSNPTKWATASLRRYASRGAVPPSRRWSAEGTHNLARSRWPSSLTGGASYEVPPRWRWWPGDRPPSSVPPERPECTGDGARRPPCAPAGVDGAEPTPPSPRPAADESGVPRSPLPAGAVGASAPPPSPRPAADESEVPGFPARPPPGATRAPSPGCSASDDAGLTPRARLGSMGDECPLHARLCEGCPPGEDARDTGPPGNAWPRPPACPSPMGEE
jgi:hypothetical protein